MKNQKYLTVLLLLTTIISMILLSCDFGVSNTILEKNISPDGSYIIYVFSRDAGATTGFNTQVSIIKNKMIFENKEGNVFICDSNNGKASGNNEYMKGGPRLRFNWTDNGNLEIYYPKGARIFKNKEKIDSIILKYYEE